MTGLLITDCYEEFERQIHEAFNTLKVLQLDNDPSQYYEQAHQVYSLTSFHPIFLFVRNSALAVIVASHLLRVRKHFYVVEWTGTRLRVLRCP